MNNDVEIWKDVVGYEGHYQVSSFGNVKSIKFGKEKYLSFNTNGVGYFHVGLSKFGIQRFYTIHILVAMAFLGHRPDGTYNIIVDHINNIKTDNNVENLQLTTSRVNVSKDRKGITSSYVGVSQAKNSNKWKAWIHVNGKNKYLGSYDCPIQASNAYQKALIMINNKIKIA